MTYSISCNICSVRGETAVYWGESHRTWFDRSENHKVALETGDKDYAVVKHMVNCHPGEEWDYKFALHGSWRSSMERQVMEAKLIDETPVEHLLNSKSEWGSNSIPCVVIQDQDKDNRGGTKRVPGDRATFESGPAEGQAKRRRTGETENIDRDHEPPSQHFSNLNQRTISSFLQIPMPVVSGQVIQRRTRVIQTFRNVVIA